MWFYGYRSKASWQIFKAVMCCSFYDSRRRLSVCLLPGSVYQYQLSVSNSRSVFDNGSVATNSDLISMQLAFISNSVVLLFLRGLDIERWMDDLERAALITNTNTIGLRCNMLGTIVTHAGCIAAGVGRAFSRVCLFVCWSVRALKWKRLQLSTPNFVHIYPIAVARHALIHRSKGQRSRSHGYENRTVARLLVTIAAILCIVLRIFLCYLRPLPAWVCMSIRLLMFSSLQF